jgi:hypothetical protein
MNQVGSPEFRQFCVEQMKKRIRAFEIRKVFLNAI